VKDGREENTSRSNRPKYSQKNTKVLFGGREDPNRYLGIEGENNVAEL
jgi:hypothetical protein